MMLTTAQCIEILKGVAGAPSLVHTPGPRQSAAGGKAILRQHRRRGRIALYQKANPNHDSRGRFTSADGAVEDAARVAGVRDYHPNAGPIRGAFRAMATAAQAKAQQLAQGIRHVVASTRLVSAKPIANGGVELQLKHRTAGSATISPATIRSTVQIHPSHVAGSPSASKALAAAHRALSATGAAPTPVRHPPITAEFSRE
jgi:hypothetical protein